MSGRPVCGSTGIYVDQCAHCPMPGAEPAPALPEPALPKRRVMRPEPAAKALSERLRTRLIGRGGTGWFPSTGRWVNCVTCRRTMAEGDPVRFVFGRTAKDMAYLGWCCEGLDWDEVKRLMRRGGYDTGEDPASKAAARKAAPKGRGGGGLLGV